MSNSKPGTGCEETCIHFKALPQVASTPALPLRAEVSHILAPHCCLSPCSPRHMLNPTVPCLVHEDWAAVTDFATSQVQDLLLLTSNLSCSSSPREPRPRRALGYLLSVCAGEGGQAHPGVPGGGPGLGRWSTHSISHQYLL